MEKLEIKDLGALPQDIAERAAAKYFESMVGVPWQRPPVTDENFEFLEFNGVKLVLLVANGNIFDGFILKPDGELQFASSRWFRLPDQLVVFVSRKFFARTNPKALERHDAMRRGCR